MKYLLVSLFLVCGAFALYGQKVAATDSLTILSVIDDWNKGWSTKNYELASQGYSVDARFTNAFGDRRNGRVEIQALLKEVFALPFVMAGNSETTEHRFQPLSDVTVIVHTSVIRKGQQMPDGSVLSDRQTTHMRIFQKEREEWQVVAHLISDARNKQIPNH